MPDPREDASYRISVRFGDELLQAGFTAVPNLVLNHYAALGITPAELVFVLHIWQYWWTEKDPYPSLRTIAGKMNVSWRQAHRYTASLKDKGVLTVVQRTLPGRGQVTNEYDFSELTRAVLRLAGMGVPRRATETPLTQMSEGGV